MYASIGTVIVDDIVLPDGRSSMGILGGGATHAAMGMRAWTDHVRLISAVGPDFTPAWYADLAASFDLRGLLHRDAILTPRCWQIFEFSGHRSEVFRTSYESFLAINPMPEEIPLDFLNIKGVHLHAQAPGPLLRWIERIRSAGEAFILWEPWGTFCSPENLPLLKEILPLVNAFSPQLEEMRDLLGLSTPRDIMRALFEAGARIVALRMGEAGSYVAAQDGLLLKVPPVYVESIIDPTGAGNAYCGGFIVGMGETGDLTQAARYGAVSGSLALEQLGALIPLDGLAERAQERLPKSQAIVEEPS